MYNDIPHTNFGYPTGEIINTHGTWNNSYSDVLTYPCNRQIVKYRISNLMGTNCEQQIKKKIEAVKESWRKTVLNIGDNLWLLGAHSENPIGFSQVLGFVCKIISRGTLWCIL